MSLEIEFNTYVFTISTLTEFGVVIPSRPLKKWPSLFSFVGIYSQMICFTDSDEEISVF